MLELGESGPFSDNELDFAVEALQDIEETIRSNEQLAGQDDTIVWDSVIPRNPEYYLGEERVAGLLVAGGRLVIDGLSEDAQSIAGALIGAHFDENTLRKS